MHKFIFIALCLSFSTFLSCAQEGSIDYQGNWIGHLPNKHSFNFKVSLEDLGGKNYHLIISNDQIIIDQKLKSKHKDRIQFNIEDQLHVNLEQVGKELSGFIKSGRFFYHVALQQTGSNKFEGEWHPFMLNDGLISDDIFLYTERVSDEEMVAYPFLGDQRTRGTWTAGFKKKGNILSFRDSNTGFNLRATFIKNVVDLEIFLVDGLITKATLTHTEEEWEYTTDPIAQDQSLDAPSQLNDGWATANINDFGIKASDLQQIIDSVHARKLINTHSILIAKQGKLIFENYYDGFNAHIPHDMRSASKSISSAMIGIAIDDQIIKSVDEKLYDFVPTSYQHTKDDTKAKISLKDLLTMSSGLDVNNLAAENTYQDPSNPNSWLQTVLEAPMVKEPGTYADYGSANPFLLGVCLNERLDIPLQTYMHEKLFAPLGITNYINQTDDTEANPYFGGGMLITPRDMLKFGQLYLNKGTWQGQRIISESWVEESFQKHVQLQDVGDKNEYGYQWWHDTYEVNGKEIEAIEARGAGGQFIFVIPELDAVVVITSGNYRNRKGNQPRDILEGYILPAMVN